MTLNFTFTKTAAKAAALSAMIAMPSASNAGGISSSGGSFILDEGNPWFLTESTTTYCILNGYDQGTFSVDKKRAAREIQEVLDDWAETTALLQSKPIDTLNAKNLNLPKQYLLAHNPEDTPNLLDPSCKLSFILGVPNGLPDIQKKLKDGWFPLRTVGFAAELKSKVPYEGRGYIYLAPDEGSDEFLKEHEYLGPKHPDLRRGYWSVENVMKNILAHEVGHTYGLGMGHHLGYLMSAKFAYKTILKAHEKTRYFRPQGIYEMNPLKDSWTCLDNWDFDTKQSKSFGKLLDLPTVSELCIKDGYPFTFKVNGKKIADGMNVSYSSSGPRGMYKTFGEGKKIGYSRHDFFELTTNYKAFGHFVAGGKKIPVMISSDYLGSAKLFYTLDGEFVEIDFISSIHDG